MSDQSASGASDALPVRLGEQEPRAKRPPTAGAAGLHFQYAPSPSGIDSNLLILMHGLGDNERSFFELGKQLQNTLPQAAMLSLRAPRRVPLLEEDAFMWWDSFTPLMEILPNQNPSSFAEPFGRLLSHLVSPVDQSGCGWAAKSIHLLGYGQGGTAALEGAIKWTLDRRKVAEAQGVLASIVTVSGPLISHPTFLPAISTPVLLYHRLGAAAAGRVLAPLKRAFEASKVSEHAAPPVKVYGELVSEAMPRAREGEWDPIVRWWATQGGWRNRSEMEMQEGVLPVS